MLKLLTASRWNSRNNLYPRAQRQKHQWISCRAVTHNREVSNGAARVKTETPPIAEGEAIAERRRRIWDVENGGTMKWFLVIVYTFKTN